MTKVPLTDDSGKWFSTTLGVPTIGTFTPQGELNESYVPRNTSRMNRPLVDCASGAG